MSTPALLALADGSLFWGSALGQPGSVCGEVVFNTALTGYQEILTDPSYCQQIVTLTYPHIGNVGVNPGDAESARPQASALVIRDYPRRASNWRQTQSLDDYLREHNIGAIADIDTRRLTRLLREKGAQSGCLMSGDQIDPEEALRRARAHPGLQGADLAQVVSTSQPYDWVEGSWQADSNTFATPQTRPYRVVAYDFGIKRNILRMLADRGCQLTVVPAQTSAAEVLALSPDGVFLSNGPGDPEPCDYAIAAARDLIESGLPTFGICLGHQIMALASGATTFKMKFGHHGANHPVIDLDSRRVMITSQNHGFAIDEASLPANVRVTHRSLFDGSNQGIELTDAPAFSFQGHPEASPGPHDVAGLFDRFIGAMGAAR